MSSPKDTGSACALAGLNVLSFTLARSLMGTWMLEAEVDPKPAPAPFPSGPVELTFARASAAPISYRGTVIEGRPHIGRGTIFAVGGAGGLREVVPPLDYAVISPRLVFEDILRDPVASDGTPRPELPDPAALAELAKLAPLPRWSRTGTAASALTRLAEKLTKVTGKPYGWRVGRTGLVWLGLEAWPAYVAKDPPYYTTEPNAAGIGVVALDAPDLDPGLTILPPDDQQAGGPLRISAVVYTLTEDGVFRARAQAARPSAGQGRVREDLRRMVVGVLPPQDLRVPWYATAVSQDADGALGLRLEDGAPFLTLSHVPYWPGLPGFMVKPQLPTMCLVEFVGGREDQPIVRSFEPNGPEVFLRPEMQYGNGTAPVARVGDSSVGGTLTGIAGITPVIFTYTPPGPGALPAVGASATLRGLIDSGLENLKG